MSDGSAHHDRADSAAAVTAVLFDLGGTLFTYAARAQMGQATIDALCRLGLDPTAADVQTARRAASEVVHREYAARPFFLHGDLFRERVARTATSLGVEVPDDVLEEFAAENVRNIIEHLAPKHDAVSTLQALKARGLYCAVVSNADDAWLEPTIRRHGLDAVLDDWTSSEEARSCKPDVAIFQYALRKADLEPGAVLFVGDSLHHDVAGAHAAGLRAVHVTGQGPTPMTDGLEAGTPDSEIEQLAELLDIIDIDNVRP
jgi:2-haloalkanoic acid dehalogenase type II